MFGEKRTEGKFFEGASAGLRVEEVDDAELEENPSTVDGQVAPLDGIEGNRVDVGGEESCELAEDLLHTDTAASHRVGPKFDEVGWEIMLFAFVRIYLLRLTVCESVVSDVVGRAVGEVEEQSSNTSSIVLGTFGSSLDSLERDSDTNESA